MELRDLGKKENLISFLFFQLFSLHFAVPANSQFFSSKTSFASHLSSNIFQLPYFSVSIIRIGALHTLGFVIFILSFPNFPSFSKSQGKRWMMLEYFRSHSVTSTWIFKPVCCHFILIQINTLMHRKSELLYRRILRGELILDFFLLLFHER